VTNIDRILLFGFCGAGGAAVSVLCGLVVAGSAARAFGDPFQFYHFAVVLAFVGAGIATGTMIAHAVGAGRLFANLGAIRGAAAGGAVSAIAGCVIAQELLPASHVGNFAVVAWGAMGGFLGLIIGMLRDGHRPVLAGVGGMTAGAAAGWLLFDPHAQLAGIVIDDLVRRAASDMRCPPLRTVTCRTGLSSYRAFKKLTRSIFCWFVNPILNR
jgi:hypothetical protein